MIAKLSNKISQLTTNSKLLVVGRLHENIEESINIYFRNKDNLDINEKSLEILNKNLFEQFDIVIFSFNKESFDIYTKNKNNIPSDSIVIISDDIYLDFKQYINLVYATLLYPIEENILLDKVYAILAVKEVDTLLKTKEKIFNKYKTDTVNDDIDIFLDQYSGSIMFINDDLNDNLNRLRDLEISKDVFSSISLNLVQLKDVLKHNKNLLNLSESLSEFSQFLDSLEFESIEPSSYVAFDYLTKIIEDITLYIDELFVYKLFKDVRIFEDSLESNIGYFEAQLLGLNDDEEIDNLEFF